MRGFLWRASGDGNTISFVNWKLVTQPRERGGIGIKSLDSINKALRGKWIWRYRKQEESLWKCVVVEVWGREGRGGWCAKEVREPFCVGVWRGIPEAKE